MTISTTRIVPDMIFYLEKFVVNSVANKDRIPFPPTISSTYLVDNKSFIRLLFDETWPNTLTSYRHLFRQETDLLSIPDTLKRRMMIYPQTSRYYVCDSDSTAICNINVFNLQEDDLTMLDLLLAYKIDNTSITLNTIVYNDLSTTLSKLIYIYLDFKINHSYTTFNTINPISSDIEVLENFYEAFLTDLIFQYLSSTGS